VTGASGVDPALAGGRLTIDLGALAANFAYLSAIADQAEAAITIKADAYGLGMAQCAPVLWEAGARSFFVALAAEGVQLRRILPKANIYVLHGVTPAGAPHLLAHDLIPMLGSPEMIALWRELGQGAPCGIHVDTGMNRLGLTPEETTSLAAAGLGGLNAVHLMSHFACADEPDHPKNAAQIAAFNAAKALFPGLRSSLQNSAGLFLGSRVRADLVRLGIALYGGEAVGGQPNQMQPVVTAEAEIMMVRQAKAGETVSYGATETLTRDTRIAVCSVGYADGWHRAGSGTGVALRATGRRGGEGWVAGRSAPVLGRITMDQTMFDVTDVPAEAVKAGDFIELFGPNIALDDAARAAGTIGYELLTSLGRRYARAYAHD
jgi:alanine racemase